MAGGRRLILAIGPGQQRSLRRPARHRYEVAARAATSAGGVPAAGTGRAQWPDTAECRHIVITDRSGKGTVLEIYDGPPLSPANQRLYANHASASGKLATFLNATLAATIDAETNLDVRLELRDAGSTDGDPPKTVRAKSQNKVTLDLCARNMGQETVLLLPASVALDVLDIWIEFPDGNVYRLCDPYPTQDRIVPGHEAYVNVAPGKAFLLDNWTLGIGQPLPGGASVWADGEGQRSWIVRPKTQGRYQLTVTYNNRYLTSEESPRRLAPITLDVWLDNE